MLTFRQKILRFHWTALILMFGLLVFGVFLIYSATFSSERPEIQSAAYQQIVWIGLGTVVFFSVALIRYQTLIDWAPWIFGVSLLSLVAVLVFGRTVYGAKSWLSLGFGSVQPGEFAKLAFICGLAWLLLRYREKGNDWTIIGVSMAAMLLPVGLILAQPDLGSAIVFGPIVFFMLLVAGLKLRYLLLPVALGVGGLLASYTVVYKGEWNGSVGDIPAAIQEGLLVGLGQLEKPARFQKARVQNISGEEKTASSPVVLLKPYQLNRIRSFFNPDLDPLGSGWTIRQCLIAIGSGGRTGNGYLQGDQNTFGFLPGTIVHNDFIFSVAAEEFGFIGGSLLIGSMAGLLICLIHIAQTAKDEGGQLLVAGFFGLMFFHYFENIGMTIKVMPITGIPLPLVSYGGTFVLTCMAGLGMVQSVWIHRKEY
jgi:rod shape determining protein RodA